MLVIFSSKLGGEDPLALPGCLALFLVFDVVLAMVLDLDLVLLAPPLALAALLPFVEEAVEAAALDAVSLAASGSETRLRFRGMAGFELSFSEGPRVLLHSSI